MDVFVSYSHDDRDWKEQVESFLKLLKRQKLLDFEIWDDRDIDYGDNWREKIDEAMENAKVAVLLVSKHFLNSDFINDVELPFFLERLRNEAVQVLPVIVAPCPVQLIPWLDALQRFPPDDRTLLGMSEADQEQHLSDLAVEVLRLYQIQSETEEPEEEAATVAPGYTFLDEAGIRSVVKEAAQRLEFTGTNLEVVDRDTLAALLFFETSNQHTWLVTVPGELHCVLDSQDNRKANRLIQWSIRLSRGVPVRARLRAGKQRTGLLDVGKRQNWLYSTNLFDPPEELEKAVREMILGALT